MDIQEIRTVFSKAIVVAHNNSITVMYLFRGRGFAQPISLREKAILSELVSECFSIRMNIDMGKSIRITFLSEFGFDPEIYDPVQQEITAEEMRALISTMIQTVPLYVAKIFQNVDFNNECDIANAFDVLLNKVQSDVSTPIAFKDAKRWGELNRIAERIPLTGQYIRSTNPPEQYYAGDIEYIFDKEYSEEVVIRRETIADIIKMIETSTGMSIEGGGTEDSYGITFFA